MSGQEKSYERVNQKRRTRTELLRAARELMEKSGPPSVAEVADYAGISRATAYRYFSTPDDMIREAVLDMVATNIRLDLPIGNAPPIASARERLAIVVKQVFDMVDANEPMFRALLAGTVTGKADTKRGARRLVWLNEALEPVKPLLAPGDFRRLVHGLALMTGIETVVVLKDVCELNSKEAVDVVLWAAKTLLAGALVAADEEAEKQG